MGAQGSRAGVFAGEWGCWVGMGLRDQIVATKMQVG